MPYGSSGSGVSASVIGVCPGPYTAIELVKTNRSTVSAIAASTAAFGTKRAVSRSMNARGMCSPMAARKAAITGWQGSMGT